MKLTIFDQTTFDIDISAQLLEKTFESKLHQFEGFWLYKEPEMKTEGNELPTFTIVSDTLGLVFIKSYEYNDNDLSEVNDKFWVLNGQKMTSEVLKFRNYTHKITSKLEDPLIEFSREFSIKIYYIFPYISKNIFTNIKLQSNERIFYGASYPDLIITEKIPSHDYDLLVSMVQNANIINKYSNIYVDEPAKNMFEAIELNNKKIAQFDFDQMAASLTITDKCERIRGLAGSGKTILLAMKAAKLHSRFPDKKIAFVFYTKSLYNQANNLIRKYYYQIADDEPNWDNLKVLHSWGGRTTGEGFYSFICRENGIVSKPYGQNTLDGLCKELLDFDDLKESFDFVLIDEAQDFPLDFFKLVYRVTRKPKKIVIAYDELQTTNDIHIPEFEELFGSTDGSPNIVLEPKYDYILKKSYRNTLEVLITAFSFGFGFYSDLTQIIQDVTTWEALGFETDSILESGHEVLIKRPRINSPNSVQQFYDKRNPVEYELFETAEENAHSIAKLIKHLVSIEKVRVVDIMVLDIKMNKTKMLNLIQYELECMDIDSHIPGIVTDARDFFRENHVTLSTPRNAKGNEVPVVFVTGCEDIYSKSSIDARRQARNFMFISITRSKGWALLSAVGKVKSNFTAECKNINKYIPNIRFIYPDPDKIKELTRINFLTHNPKAKAIDNDINKLKLAIELGDATLVKQLIDLDPDFKKALQKLIGD